jgi:hypothetical protein
MEESGYEVYVSETTNTVGTAPVGLLMLVDSDILICKSEYTDSKGNCNCYIVESGETYWGEGNGAKCRAIIIE